MEPQRRELLRLMAAGAALPALSNIASAQTWPSRPVRIVVPVPPGGPNDFMGRLAAQILSEALGQQFIVENRPGAGSTLAAKAVAAAEPDGYTLLVVSPGSMAIGPMLYPAAAYDPATAFAPVGYIANTPFVMISRPQASYKTLPELIAYAKANPGKLNFGVPNGVPPHMIAAWFRVQTGTDIVIVPYAGAAMAMTDLMGGHVDLGFETTSVTLPHVREGTVRALGVTTANRLPEIPDVPTMIESGVPDFIAVTWYGLVAPAGTPKPIIDRLSAGLVAGLKSPQMRERFKQLGAIANPGTPEDFASFLAKEIPKWVAMAKLSGVKPE